MDVSTHTAVSNLESEPGVSMGDVSVMTRSQMSVGQVGSSTTLSMRAKAARKRKVNAQHNSNFRAGYVPVEEDALHRTGIRGRKRYFLYCAVLTLVIITALNMMMTAWLLYMLGISHYGMASMELTTVAGRDFLRVLAEARIITMSFSEASLGSRFNSTLVLESKESLLQVESLSPGGGSWIKLEEGNITITTGQFGISTNNGSDWVLANLPSLASHRLINNLLVDNVTVRQVQELQDKEGLNMESHQNIAVSGAQGLHMTTMKVTDMSGLSVFMDAQEVTMDTKHGVYLNRLPVVTTSDVINPDLQTHKVCVCQSGLVFTVEVNRPGVSCHIGPQLDSICGGGSA